MSQKSTIKYIIGIDEVGRGPLAGPVAVCSFIIKDDSLLKNQEEKKLPKLKDSKKLSSKQREIWFEYLKKSKAEDLCDYSVSFVSGEFIDKFGINKCIQKALNESLLKVTSPEMLFERSSLFIFLDGGLHAKAEYLNQETIIRGDELHPVISMASIMAKVSRDRIMIKYAKDYPEYGFERHMGYGTKAHYEAIKTYGQTLIHRKTFIH